MPVDMRLRARVARWLFRRERDALARRVFWGAERSLRYGDTSSFGSAFLRIACGCLWLTSTAVLCAGAAAVTLVFAVALGEAGALVSATALLVFASNYDAFEDPWYERVPFAAVFVVASAYFPVAVAAGYDIEPTVLLSMLFDWARDPLSLLRTWSDAARDVLELLRESFSGLLRRVAG